MGLESCQRVKEDQSRGLVEGDLARLAKNLANTKIGDLVYSFEYGFAYILDADGVCCFYVKKLNSQDNEAKRPEIVAGWEFERLPSMVQPAMTEDDLEMLLMLHPEVHPDLVLDIRKDLMDRYNKKKIGNKFKKLLTWSLSLLRCLHRKQERKH